MLSIPSGQQDVELGISTTQITISDNDGKFLLRRGLYNCCALCNSLQYAVVMIQFEQVSCTVFEDSGIAEIIVTKTGLHATAISILFSTQNGSTAGILIIS